MTWKTLFSLIMECQQLLDEIGCHPDYVRLRESEYLVGLDVTLADSEAFLMGLNKALGEMTESEVGSCYPPFEEIFGENSLTLLEPSITPINSLEERF